MTTARIDHENIFLSSNSYTNSHWHDLLRAPRDGFVGILSPKARGEEREPVAPERTHICERPTGKHVRASERAKIVAKATLPVAPDRRPG